MSAQGFTQTILTPSGGYLTGNTGLLANLSLKDVDPETGDLLGNSYPATSHIGNGQYAFGTIPYACYKLYNDATPVPGFHGDTVKGRWIGSSSFSASIITSGTLAEARLPTGINANKIADGSVTSAEFQYLGGVTSDIQTQLNGKGNLSGANPSGQWEFSGAYPLVDDAIPSPTDLRHVTTKDYVDTADALALHKAGAETITGAKLWKAASVIDTANGGTLQQSVYLAPPSNLHFTPKQYVDEQVASVIASPYQEGNNHVRIITNGTTEAGKVYKYISSASSYLGTPTNTNPAFISLVKGDSAGVFHITGSGTIKDYLTIAGKGLRHWVCLSDTNTSLTKNVEFQNLTLFFGTNDIPAARSYNSFTFRNCIIYAYESTTFTACKFYNTLVIHAATKAASLSSCIAWDSHFNQYLASDTAVLGVYTEGFDTGASYYALPTDPSLSI